MNMNGPVQATRQTGELKHYDTAWQLADLLEGQKSIFMRMEPEVPDFTIRASFKILIWSLRQKLVIEVDPSNIQYVISLFDQNIFNKDRVDRLYVWGLKPLCTYLRAFCPKFVTPTTNLIDLKIIESFLGVRKKRPENAVEAINRVKLAVQHKNWQKLYKAIHLPLSLRVLPSIETTPLLNDETRKSVYPYYEIEGQTNGRMNCLNKYANSYLPHNMGTEVRSVLKPRGEGMRLCTADFKSCEVAVLQWLSGDEKIKEILDSGEDLHRAIYKIVTGDQCDSDSKRNISKKMFLPVMYGCGPKGLAVNLDVGEPVGAELLQRIRKNFPTATHFMMERQKEAKSGRVTDYFGRPRQFPEGESYRFRNTAVQAVAATVCQEKLIALWKSLDGETARLAFSVHDGYGIVCDIPNAKQTYETVKDTLESESILCPGLKMKVAVKFGTRLSNMKTLWRD